ncbi:MAG TPA: hypothetical protein VK785_09425 [Opitutaceae bacterium]|jgi:hypothetical protein|nr:hypothetical protein [Opitutaceae bacterium]
MAKGLLKEATPNSLISAANYVKRSSRAILARGGDGARTGTTTIQRNCLIEWFKYRHEILAGNFCRQFHYFGEGAEHLVYFDLENLRAIKSTHPNQFGHSVAYEGARATPLEYLRRLVYHNWFFGDDIRLLGAIIGDDHLEIITSQPWITAHQTTPQASEAQIIQYFAGIRFRKSQIYPAGALFYSSHFNLVAADAHSRNVLVSDAGDIVAIDVVIGRPGQPLEERLRREFPKDTPDSIQGPSTSVGIN